ncbi:MAG: DUF711 family protein [Candidatus Hydrogenedentes bacterium]|nr:DUF711 family protein [Candidatus Hydrogenedentota bacterium]
MTSRQEIPSVLDLRAVTICFNARTLALESPAKLADSIERRLEPILNGIRESVARFDGDLRFSARAIRLAIPPIGDLGAQWQKGDFIDLARRLDAMTQTYALEFAGGFSVTAGKSTPEQFDLFVDAMKDCLLETSRVCGFLNVASSNTGVNLKLAHQAANLIRETAAAGNSCSMHACGRLAVCCNNSPHIPYMPLGSGCPDSGGIALSVGMGTLRPLIACLERISPAASMESCAAEMEKTVFQLARCTATMLDFLASELNLSPGVIDVSVAPIPQQPDASVLRLFQLLGVEHFSTPGSLAVVAMINQAIKRGGFAASLYVGGLSGTFLSVAEDPWFQKELETSTDVLNRLYAMSAVCSVGIDMVAIPLDTGIETLAGMIADVLAFGCRHGKTTALRVIPFGNAGDRVEFTELPQLGATTVVPTARSKPSLMFARSGILPVGPLPEQRKPDSNTP